MRFLLTTIILTMFAQPVWAEPIKLLCYQLPEKNSETTYNSGLMDFLEQMTQRLEELNSELDAATTKANRSKSYDGPPDRDYSVYEFDPKKPSFKEASATVPWWEELFEMKFLPKIEEIDDANLRLTFETPKLLKIEFVIDRVSGLVERNAYHWRTEKKYEWQDAEGWESGNPLISDIRLNCQRYSNELRQF